MTGRTPYGAVALAAAALALAACGSTETPTSAVPRTLPSLTATAPSASASAAPAQSPLASSPAAPVAAPLVSSPAAAAAAAPLTGFGATFDAWAAHHIADPDGQTTPGCCFEPAFEDPDNGGRTDTFVLPLGEGKPVSVLLHRFAPGTGEAAALADVRRLDLPADAVLVSHVENPGCAVYEYRSSALAQQLGAGQFIVVTFASPGDTYEPSHTSEANLGVQHESGDASC